MFNFIKQQIKDFDDYSFMNILKIFFFISGIIIFYGLIYSGFQIVDEFEHLHASWMVAEGKIPYRDFFEHHHPLLWYFSAPIVSFFYENAIIFYVMRAISTIASIITLVYIYKISLFFTDKKGGLLAIVFCISNIITLYNFYQFRPDNFMNLFFITGIYYWFLHIKDKQAKHLTISFIYFAISVMFLQKIAALLILIGNILIWLIFTKAIKLKTTLLSSIPAILILSGFIVCFLITGTFYEYISLNLRFNQALVYYFERGSFWYGNLFFSIYGLGFIIAFSTLKKKNIYLKIIAIIYIGEFLMRAFYFAPHPNYYVLLTYINALLIATFVNDLEKKYKIIRICLIIGLFLYEGYLFNTLSSSAAKYNSFEHYKLTDYVHKNSNSNDKLMNGYDKNFNIYRNDVSYYWFGLDMLLPVMEQEFGLDKIIDINSLIIYNKPKFVYTLNYVDLRALRMYGEIKYSQIYNTDILNILYKPTEFKNLAILR